MRKKLALIFAFIMIILIMFIPTIAAQASSDPIDEILEYYINVDMESDGSAIITYHIKWKVLDDKTEGPVENLYVGIPNKHVEDIKALSDNIKNIEYTNSYNGSYGSYVKIDFFRKYYQDETFEFDFSIHQSYLYTLDDDNETVSFSFTPGWFPDTPIDDLIISWNGNYVVENNSDYTDENNQLIWKTSLDSGKSSKLSASVTYQQSRFEELDPNKQAENTDLYISIIVIIAIIVVLVVFFLFTIFSDGYGSGGGTFFYSSGGHGGGCASSCACACACAGGGRAGCSTKDFYTNVDTISLEKAFEEAKKTI